MLRKYYVIINKKTNAIEMVIFKRDFKNIFYKEILEKIKHKDYRIKVM